MTDDHGRCEWVNVSSGTSSPPDKIRRAVKWLCVCVCRMVKLPVEILLTKVIKSPWPWLCSLDVVCHPKTNNFIRHTYLESFGFCQACNWHLTMSSSVFQLWRRTVSCNYCHIVYAGTLFPAWDVLHIKLNLCVGFFFCAQPHFTVDLNQICGIITLPR